MLFFCHLPEFSIISLVYNASEHRRNTGYEHTKYDAKAQRYHKLIFMEAIPSAPLNVITSKYKGPVPDKTLKVAPTTTTSRGNGSNDILHANVHVCQKIYSQITSSPTMSFLTNA